MSTSPASLRTSVCDVRSATNTSSCPPVAALISRAALSARAALRPVIATCAPIAARPRAVALPMPSVPPVTSAVLPVNGPWSVSATGCPLLDLGSGHEPEPDSQRDDQPDHCGDGDVGPLLAGEGTVEVEQGGLGVVDVDPG